MSAVELRIEKARNGWVAYYKGQTFVFNDCIELGMFVEEWGNQVEQEQEQASLDSGTQTKNTKE